MAKTKSGIEVKYRIGTVSAFFLYALGAFGWLIGFLLMLTGIGEIGTWILDIVGEVMYIFWYGLLGVNYFSGKSAQKLGIIGTSSLVNLTPFINGIVPTFVIETWAMIRVTRKEDEERAEKAAQDTAQAQAAEMQKIQNQMYVVERARAAQQAANDNEEALARAA